MQMDMLRSCYRSKMRLYPDRPDVLTEGQWYWCLPHAQILPQRHAFGSSLWDWKGAPDDVAVGEVERIPGWVSGATDARNVGQHYCGDARAWQQGIPYADRPGLELGPDGLPLCCHYPAITASELEWELFVSEAPVTYQLDLAWELEQLDADYPVELAWELESAEDVPVYGIDLAWEVEAAEGGEVLPVELAFEFEWTSPGDVVVVACGVCTAGPLNWRLVVAGFSGDSSALNGTWFIRYSGAGCQWDSLGGGSPAASPFWRVNYTGGGGWQVTGEYQVLNVFGQYSVIGAWQCTGPMNSCTLTGQNNLTTPPSTVTVEAF